MKNVSKIRKTVNSFLKLWIIPIYQTGLWFSLKRLPPKNFKNPTLPCYWVGGFRMGGSGKTAFIISLAKQAQKQGLKVVIMAYWINKKSYEKYLWITSKTSWKNSSEEAILLKKNTNCSVVVTRDRWHCWNQISQQNEYDLMLSDDGVLDFRLRQANGIWLSDPNELEKQKSYFQRWPLGAFRFSSKIILPHHDIVYGPLLEHKSKPPLYFTRSLIFPKNFDFTQDYCVLTAIGNPQRFVDDLKRNSVKIKHYHFLRNHQPISESAIHKMDINHFSSQQRDKTYPILMTSKDFIKISQLLKKKCIEVKEKIRTSYRLQKRNKI